MSAPVDVLAVMRDAELLGSLASATPETMQRLEQARAAVAELIEAASDLVEISAMALQLGVIPENANGPLPRTIAALARCGGAS
jgi:hypothetical protein